MTSTIVNNPPRPGSKAWRAMITASKIPAIIGVSRYKSPFALWHEMAGNLTPEPMDARRAHWGHVAEQSLAQMWLYDKPGWKLNPPRTLPSGERTTEIAYTRTDLGFPNLATIDRRAYKSRSEPFHIIECKTARSLDDWGREGEPDAVPTDYLTQVMWQMGISGIHQATVVVLARGSGPEFHEVEFDQDLFDGLVDAAREWHLSLAAGVEPDLDDTVSTYEAVRGLHPEIERGTSVEVSREQALAYLDAVHVAKEAEAKLRLERSTLARLMGTAHKAVCDGVKIADRRRGNHGVSIHPNTKAAL